MFDNLEDILIHYEEVMMELGSPDVANDQTKFRKLMKEQSDLLPLVEAYKAYKEAKQSQEDALSMLDTESDEEIREMAKEELAEGKKKEAELTPCTACARDRVWRKNSYLHGIRCRYARGGGSGCTD